MPWPYAVFTFVALALFRAGYTAAAIVSVAACLVYLAAEFRDLPRRGTWAVASGVVLGALLFFVRLPLIGQTAPIQTTGKAEVIGVSRRSVVMSTEPGHKIRLTGFGTRPLPHKYATIRYSCKQQPVPDSSFAVFERLAAVQGWCRVTSYQTLGERTGMIHSLRRQALDFLHMRFDKMGAKSLVAAFLLGDTEDLDTNDLDAFRSMGLMHLFAVSGMNIALLFGLLYLPFSWIGVPKVGSALGYSVATAFLLLLDFPAPLLRAWLFMTIALAMHIIDRRLATSAMLFITALAVEIMFPLSTFSISFILSFAITAAIVVFYPQIHFLFASRNRILDILASHVALTLSAGIPALILGYLLFGSAQPLSLLYNLLLVPFSGIYLFSALVYLMFDPARYILLLLDRLYLKFAELHRALVMDNFPSADDTTQRVSLIVMALVLILLLVLARRQRLWSARRNLRYAIPLIAIALLLPYFLVRYPGRAIYAIPNKVWMYNERRLVATGKSAFAQHTTREPRTCFPISERKSRGTTSTPDLLRLDGSCFVFSGRMRPELWHPRALAGCRELNLYVSKSASINPAEWKPMFALFGYAGEISIRHYFRWYSDVPLACDKSEPL
jgi:ComEC/Rec2-related protein